MTVPVPARPTFGVFYIAAAGTPALPDNVEPKRDAFSFHSDPKGWFGMVDSNEELEYVIEGNTVRVRLDWGNQWSGSEYQAAKMVSEGNPVALMIRGRGKLQEHTYRHWSAFPKGAYFLDPLTGRDG